MGLAGAGLAGPPEVRKTADGDALVASPALRRSSAGSGVAAVISIAVTAATAAGGCQALWCVAGCGSEVGSGVVGAHCGAEPDAPACTGDALAAAAAPAAAVVAAPAAVVVAAVCPWRPM